MLTFQEFSDLAQKGNLIPVTEKLAADMETPVTVLARLQEDENVFLLESVEAGERFGRYSFIGLNPRGVFTVENGKAYYAPAEGKKRELAAPEGPLMALRTLMKGLKPALPPDMPAFIGGAVGAIGYEAVGEFENLPAPKPGLRGPTSSFMIADDLIIFDNFRHTLMLSAAVRTDEFETLRAAYDEGVRRVRVMKEKLARPARPGAAEARPVPELRSNCTESSFTQMVEKARAHIREGNIIQVVLSQKFSGETDIPPLTLYRALRLINPSPYTFFMKMGKLILISSSPETLCRTEAGGKALLRPIAGTRPRGKTPAEDAELEKSLLADPKERAEHLMLVDLARNDLGRIAAPGTVKVSDFMSIQRFSHVMHLTSRITARLQPDLDALDVLAA
ncbi:MAG: anthranilate synthase component I family protein, partial [Sutterella wadsworthensis]|nr:anthranilate synthase component I family protein [Sutterella wadsworthensis]